MFVRICLFFFVFLFIFALVGTMHTVDAIPTSTSVIVETKIGIEGVLHQKVTVTYPKNVYEFILNRAKYAGYKTLKSYILSQIPREIQGRVWYKKVENDNEVTIIVEVTGLTPEEAKKASYGKVRIEKKGKYIIFEDASFSNQTHAKNAWLHYYLQMPGKIVDTNAEIVKDDKAEWHLMGDEITTVYAVSKTPLLPSFSVVLSITAVAISLIIKINLKK